MGKKLMEQTGAEMAVTLVTLAGPVRSFLDDAEFQEAWVACTKKGVKNQLTGFLTIYADMTPLLFGSKHLRDTMAIIAAIEGKSAEEALAGNGVDLLADAMKAWKEQLLPFFQRLGVSV